MLVDKADSELYLEVIIIELSVFEDERGWFMESFNEERFHGESEKTRSANASSIFSG